MKAKKNNKNFAVGICAYNEEKNIGQLLTAIDKQKTGDFVLKEIIIIASGCTDNTTKIIEKHPLNKKVKIKVISEKERKGKAKAVNVLLSYCQTNFLILESADTLPHPKAYYYLLTKLQDKKVGLTAAQIKQLNPNKKTIVGFANWLLWQLHHKINLQNPNRPKVGEILAFKRIFEKIPEKTAVDEANIELLILGQGYDIVYCSQAIVYNKGPENLREFLSRRRSNYFGHKKIADKLGYQVVTYNIWRSFFAFLLIWEWKPDFLFKSIIVALLELIARFFAYIDYKFNVRDHSVWKIAKTSKKLK